MACRGNGWAAMVCAAVLALSFKSPALEQQKNSAVSSSAVETIDPAAELDELIRQANEQMNAKGQFQKAGELAQQAFDLSQKLGDRNRTLEAMMCLASVYYFQGRMPEALELSKNVAVLAKEVGNRKTLSRALNRIAAVLGELGRFEESLSYLYQCMDVAREQRDQVLQHVVLINIGELYVRTGDPDKAEAPLLESLRIAYELKSSEPGSNLSKKATELSLKFLGEMEAAREQYKPALAYLQQVRESRPESEQAIIGLLDTMAAIYRRIGEPRKAVELLDEARDRARKAGSVSYSLTLAELGESQEWLGQLNEALASENLALAEVRKSGGNADYEWQIERRIGHIQHGLGGDEEALTHYRNSIYAIERLRASALNTEPGKAGFTSRSQAVYAETADLLYALGRVEEALEMAERGRARAFLDMLTEARIGLAEELTPDQRKHEDAILSRISAVQKELWRQNLSAEERRKNDAQLTSAEADLEKFRLEVRQSNPDYASLQYPEPVRAADIRSKLLDEHTALIEYLLGEQRSLVWVVTKHKITTFVLPARKNIEEQVAAYRKVLAERVSSLTLGQSLAEITSLGSRLYKSIFSPIEKDLGSSHTVIIVPDGTLGYLPFEALVTGSAHGRPAYLAEKFAVVNGPSASALVSVRAMHRDVSWPKALLAFGDPTLATATSLPQLASVKSPNDTTPPLRGNSLLEDYSERGFSLVRLPYAREEVRAIGRLFPVSKRQLYLGSDAREETVKTEKLDDFRFIHFASHGFLDEARPGRSGILLARAPDSAEDGILQVGEIMRLKLNADLVTLSACSTGLGRLVNGEGVLGLSRAFLYAGAANVAVSLWDVNDSATASLMESFYGNLNRGMPKSEALRQAKLSLLVGAQHLWQHPYFWAAFILEGEGQ